MIVCTVAKAQYDTGQKEELVEAMMRGSLETSKLLTVCKAVQAHWRRGRKVGTLAGLPSLIGDLMKVHFNVSDT